LTSLFINFNVRLKKNSFAMSFFLVLEDANGGANMLTYISKSFCVNCLGRSWLRYTKKMRWQDSIF